MIPLRSVNIIKIIHAIEKEIEVIDGRTDEEIDKFISALCDDEDGDNYIWIKKEKRKNCELKYNF